MERERGRWEADPLSEGEGWSVRASAASFDPQPPAVPRRPPSQSGKAVHAGSVLMIYAPYTAAFVHSRGPVVLIKGFLGAGSGLAMLFCSMQCRLLHKSKEFSAVQPP